MNKYTFDTNFIVSNKLSEFPDNFLLSEVVIFELIASSQDETKFKWFQQLRNIYAADALLITPSAEDWAISSKIVHWIEIGKKLKNKGNAPAKRPGATQRMAMDTLIAMSARRMGVTVVTDNIEEFSGIKYYRDFKLVKGSDFLG